MFQKKTDGNKLIEALPTPGCAIGKGSERGGGVVPVSTLGLVKIVGVLVVEPDAFCCLVGGIIYF